jgi:hypothetical protein
MKIVLDIERLVLDGMTATPAEAARISTAVERELARLLGTAPVPPRLTAGGAVASLPAAHLDLAGRSTPEAIGKGIAQAVHGGLNETP